MTPSPARSALALALAVTAACESPSSPRGPGIDLDPLFLPPTAAEAAAVRADWAARSSASALEKVDSVGVLALGDDTLRVLVLSHRVGGVLHHGAALVPVGSGPGSLPVLLYLHGGDRGVDVLEPALVARELGALGTRLAYVVPSFRSETLRVGGRTWLSEGEPSPWDRDVDDTLALLRVALEAVPEADGGRIAALGQSRGAAVAMLAAVREPAIARVVELFGPTDFFSPWVRGIVEAILAGSPPQLPGLDALDAAFLQPWVRGELDLAPLRLELLRRSPARFAADLPLLQVHHGTEDSVVPVAQAERLIQALTQLGQDAAGFEAWIYPGGGHDAFSLEGARERVIAFLEPLLDTPPSVGSAAGPGLHPPRPGWPSLYRVPKARRR